MNKEVDWFGVATQALSIKMLQRHANGYVQRAQEMDVRGSESPLLLTVFFSSVNVWKVPLTTAMHFIRSRGKNLATFNAASVPVNPSESAIPVTWKELPALGKVSWILMPSCRETVGLSS